MPLRSNVYRGQNDWGEEMIWLALSAITMAVTAIYHSYAGEKIIVRPFV